MNASGRPSKGSTRAQTDWRAREPWQSFTSNVSLFNHMNDVTMIQNLNSNARRQCPLRLAPRDDDARERDDDDADGDDERSCAGDDAADASSGGVHAARKKKRDEDDVGAKKNEDDVDECDEHVDADVVVVFLQPAGCVEKRVG